MSFQLTEKSLRVRGRLRELGQLSHRLECNCRESRRILARWADARFRSEGDPPRCCWSRRAPLGFAARGPGAVFCTCLAVAVCGHCNRTVRIRPGRGGVHGPGHQAWVRARSLRTRTTLWALSWRCRARSGWHRSRGSADTRLAAGAPSRLGDDAHSWRWGLLGVRALLAG